MYKRMEGRILQIKPNTIDINYLAGLIDGEGFFTINYRKNRQTIKCISHDFIPVVGVHMTAVELLKQIKQQYGGNLYTREGTNKIRADWSIRQAKNVYPFLIKLIPYLRVKKPQALIMKEFCERFKFFTGKKIHKLNDQEINQRKLIKQTIMHVNKMQT